MVDAIQVLQREVNEELSRIANSLELRIENYVPQNSTQYAEVKQRLDDLKLRVGEKLQVADSMIEDLEDSAQSIRHKASLNSSSHMIDLKFVLESLYEIENNLLVVNWNSPAPIEEAKLLMEATEYLQGLLQEGNNHKVVERIRHLLHKDLTYNSSYLLTKLNQECKDLFSFPTGGVKGYNLMKIRVKDSKYASEVLTALEVMHEFKTKVNKWSEKIFSDFCTVIVSSRGGPDCFEFTIPSSDTFLFTSNQKVFSTEVDVASVFATLSSFFEHLHRAIGSLKLGSDGRPLSLYIGRGLEEKLMNLLLKNCISLAAPMTDKNDPRFVKAMTEASNFRELMIKLHFWNESAPQFLAYAEANDSVFINRRCLDILGNAKKLVMEPYIRLTEVGTGSEITEETINAYSEAMGTKLKIEDLAREDEAYPKFMQLQRCKVSTSAVSLVELIEKTVSDAVEADNELLKARLLTTAQNILRLYNSIAAKHHAAAISSVPQAAAVYFNNNYYICHRLILLPFAVVDRFPDEIKKLQEDIYPILVDNIWHLRESASASLEAMLTNTRRQLSTLLTDRHLFVGLQDAAKMADCKRVIRACCNTISSIRDNWKEVMAETVFCKSLGDIVSFFLADLANMFLIDVEDIRASDADVSGVILSDTLDQLQAFFVIRGKTMIHTFCDTAYFRLKEVIFCLNGSLQGISDRWCDRKGPLAQWLTVSEVRTLIKALFMNTEQRKNLLESLC